MKHPDYTLYMVTDMPSVYKKGLLASVEAAVAGGVTIVQYRADGGTKRELYETSIVLRDLLKSLKVPFIINDHVDLALAIDSDGVHVGQSDLPATIVRQLIGKKKILGLSVSNREQLAGIDKSLVDYIGIGPVFPTQSKRNAAPAIGTTTLKDFVALSPLPSVAIGGIGVAQAASVYASGVAGIAVVSALSYADDIQAAARTLLGAKGKK